MPLSWNLLDSMDPAEFTIRTVPGLAERGDPWGDFRSQSPDLGQALTRLQSLAEAERAVRKPIS
jgi:DNA primase